MGCLRLSIKSYFMYILWRACRGVYYTPEKVHFLSI